MTQKSMTHATNSTNLADLLERILDKGVVVAGDIKIKLVEIELLTIQIRLVICSVERAVEMGMDWWQRDPNLSSLAAPPQPALPDAREATAASTPEWPQKGMHPPRDAMERRISELEASLRRMESQLQAHSSFDRNPPR